MIRYRTASLALAFICLLSGGDGASAQDFLQELFGYDAPSSNSHRAYGHRNAEHFSHGGSNRERYRSRGSRVSRGHSERFDDAEGSNRSYEGARSSRPAAAMPRREDDGSSWGNGTEFCVRTCDGYFFPLIKSAQQTKQASCEYACPSAPVAYYHGSSIETARNLDGEKYTSLPMAFKFREKVSAGCTCHPPEESQQHSLKIVKNDPTAHSGDIVVEQKGAFVYQGKQAVPIDRSRQLSASVRQNIHKMTAGPAPAGGIDQSAQKNADASLVTGSVNNGVLSGAARPMGELDAAAVNSGESDVTSSWAIPALLLLAALSFGAVAALRLSPGLRERLLSLFKGATAAPTTVDVIDATPADSGEVLPRPQAWVWTEYRGASQLDDAASGSKPSTIAPNLLTTANTHDTIGSGTDEASVNDRPLSGQAGLTSEMGAASLNFNLADRSALPTIPALLSVSALSGWVTAAKQLMTDLRDRLFGFFKELTNAPSAVDSVSGSGSGASSPTPMAWVWSEYRGVAQPVVEAPAPETSTSATTSSIDQIGGLSPTSIA